MNNEIKNKFDDFEVEPPDYILDNLKNNLGFTKKPFLVKHKYSIAASLVGAVIAMVFILSNKTNKNITENIINNKTIINKTTPKAKQNKVITEVKQQEKQEAKQQKSNKKVDNTKNNVIDVQTANNNTNKIYIGDDIIICGTECILGKNSNAKIGKWLSNINIKFSDITNPVTFITSKVFGKQNIIWVEKTKDTYIYDTIMVEFQKAPENLKIEQVNEHCGRSDAIVEFLTNEQNYKYKWSDNVYTTKPIRKDLSTGKYTVTVSNEFGCSANYEFEIKNTEQVNTNFFHTELYSSINTPIYFTDRTEVTTVDKNELKYEWDFGDGSSSNKINPEHTYSEAGEYIVTLSVSTKNNCSDTYETKFVIEESLNKMPNIFTPNGDGIHDILIINPKPLSNFKGLIFNKAGRQIYEWNNQYEGWDGNLENGEPAIEGVYYYVVTGIDSEMKKFQYRGFVHLNR